MFVSPVFEIKQDCSLLIFPSSGNKQPTGNESLVEKWILHKLNIATAETNKQLNERNFMAATNAVYNFWLYELCDVYIVRPSSFHVLELAG
jgi:valyl-tRNA synthetase